MGSIEKSADTNLIWNPAFVKGSVLDKSPLYLDKYLLNSEGYPHVLHQHLARHNVGAFRPVDVVNGDLVVRRARNNRL